MALKLLIFIGGLITLCFVDSVSAGSTCSRDCTANHPQQMFCDASFAFDGTVMKVEELPEFYMYEVKIWDGTHVYKGIQLIEIDENDEADVFTSFGDLCGRTNLEVGKRYLFTGKYIEGFLVITYCDWVEEWDAVTEQQKRFLESEYSKHCSLCKIHGVKGALETDKEDEENHYPNLEHKSHRWTPIGCYFNPVPSIQYMGFDCESAYTFCHLMEDGSCDWNITEKYKDCFIDRENAWEVKNEPRPAAALTEFSTLKDCKKLPTKKMRKNCVKTVQKWRKNRKEELEPQAMLEELLALRDLWLEDGDDDDFLIE